MSFFILYFIILYSPLNINEISSFKGVANYLIPLSQSLKMAPSKPKHVAMVC